MAVAVKPENAVNPIVNEWMKLNGYDRATEKKISEIAAYTVVIAFLLCAIPAIIYYYRPGTDAMVKLLVYISCAGGLGGVVYSVLGFTKHYRLGDFDLGYKYWYLFRPFVAILLGIFSFFFIAGGLMTLANVSQEAFSAVQASIVTKMFYVALAFLAGFSTNNFVAKLEDISQSLFGKEKDNGDDGQGNDQKAKK